MDAARVEATRQARSAPRASALFLRDGYEKVSLRAVAREAEVDPALVHHYFTWKAALFLLALTGVAGRSNATLPPSWMAPPTVWGIAPSNCCSNVETPPFRRRWQRWWTALKGRLPARARAAIEMVAREVFVPVAAHFGHADATLRAQLAASALVGGQVGHVPSRPLPGRAFLSPLARTLQYYLVDTW
ncbi:TetR family transcriptional regulator [Propioniciclava flava]